VPVGLGGHCGRDQAVAVLHQHMSQLAPTYGTFFIV
jgi:hypothetical protein